MHTSGPAWHPKAALGNGITIPFAAGKSGSRGLAKCQATGFPKVKLDVRERSQPGSNRHQGGNQGPKGRRVQRTLEANAMALALTLSQMGSKYCNTLGPNHVASRQWSRILLKQKWGRLTPLLKPSSDGDWIVMTDLFSVAVTLYSLQLCPNPDIQRCTRNSTQQRITAGAGVMLRA